MAANDHDKTIGFIGLGLMGSAMAEMLLDDGHDLVVWNREPEPLEDFERRGARVASSPADLAAHADVIVICVLHTEAVQAVCLGESGVVQTGKAGTIIIDHSTAMPQETVAIAAELAERAGMSFVDAPVSGGPAFARQRKLTIMAGGAEADIETTRKLMRTYAQNITRMGDIGAGQMTKVINQAIAGVSYVLMAEVVRIAEESGIDAAKIPQCLAGGHADSVMLNYAYPKMLQRDFEPPASLASQMLKDLKNVGSEAQRFNLDLPLVASATRQFSDYVQNGGGKRETASIYESLSQELSASTFV
ncbi:NAD(P)-dependent oxidoreductase [Devosia algicola]|uniref:NAD(P)-dependent oxidoreductase n=1 Tax=Devosia algicola TaxID=3026418 RepID=A0ABY7YQG1_9HYPH|nr:NAD(P)-dependent oxidoreductase [Devosia algicola]WDR03496.1 NAD(P)-dependent oxidoreductase [Devosia algicola]